MNHMLSLPAQLDALVSMMMASTKLALTAQVDV
jgi:hypothetical protein